MGGETDGRSNGPFRPFYYFPLRNNILKIMEILVIFELLLASNVQKQ